MHQSPITEQFNETRTNSDLGVQGLEVFNILSKSADRNVADGGDKKKRGGVKSIPYIF